MGTMASDDMAITAGLWLMNVGVGAFLGAAKGRMKDGAMLALTLGPLGWFVILMGPRRW